MLGVLRAPAPKVNTSGIKYESLGIDGPMTILTSEVIRAARALLRWDQRTLAQASSISLPTIKRLESKPGALEAHTTTVAALTQALENAGIQFIDENGGGPGVRLRRRQRVKPHK
jgi:transcriptional regulator with XRE-family HTH domain